MPRRAPTPRRRRRPPDTTTTADTTTANTAELLPPTGADPAAGLEEDIGHGAVFRAQCHCGRVRLRLAGLPRWSGWCHSRASRLRHSAPRVGLLGYASNAVVVDAASEPHLSTHTRSVSCATCRTTVLTAMPQLGAEAVAVSLQALRGDPDHGAAGAAYDPRFAPTFHMSYKEGQVSCFDTLPKYAGVPSHLRALMPGNAAAAAAEAAAADGDGTIEGADALLPDGFHGRSKPSEHGRTCLVEFSGLYRAGLAAYNGPNGPSCTNNPSRRHRGTAMRHPVSCFCGAVAFGVRGTPDWAANCHCTVCRRLHGAPFVSMCGYSNAAVEIDDPAAFAERTTMYNCDGASQEDRFACNVCGSRVLSRLKHLGCSAVFLSNVDTKATHPDPRFLPSAHIFYASGAADVLDDLPKLEGFPPSLGGTDGRMLRSDIHPTSCGGSSRSSSTTSVPTAVGGVFAVAEGRGTALAGVLALLTLLLTPHVGAHLMPLVGAGDEWAHMPWRPFMSPWEQWVRMPTFLVCEYVMLSGACLCAWHARRNGALPLWFAAWVCGTANDVFFMFLPFCDNFWQAQATVMLTPRLPLYIVAMYVCLMYFANTAAMRLGFASPLAEACAAGLLGALLYGVYDFNGPRFLWWTWHDSDAAIHERLGGAPVGSTMWILTYTSLFNLLFRWATRGGTGEARGLADGALRLAAGVAARCGVGTGDGERDSDGDGGEFAGLPPLAVRGVRRVGGALETLQQALRSRSDAVVICAVGMACTPLFMILLGQFSVFSLDVAGKPGVQTLALCCAVFCAVVWRRGFSLALPRKPRASGPASGDAVLGGFMLAYFAIFCAVYLCGDPSTHVSTGVHQAWSSAPCGSGHSKAWDIMGFARDDHLCGQRRPRDASETDFVWGGDCGAGLAARLAEAGVVGAADALRTPVVALPTAGSGGSGKAGGDGFEVVEWYTVCGVSDGKPESYAATGFRLALVASFGAVFYSYSFCGRQRW